MSAIVKTEICRLIPHQDAMCLLHTVESWTESSIDCSARSHRETTNPLRVDNKLDSICGLEYAAQAMAVHIGLMKTPASPPQRIGYLGGLRDIALMTGRLDTWDADLLIHVMRLHAEENSFLYRFRIHVPGRELMSGRVSIFLTPIDG